MSKPKENHEGSASNLMEYLTTLINVNKDSNISKMIAAGIRNTRGINNEKKDEQ